MIFWSEDDTTKLEVPCPHCSYYFNVFIYQNNKLKVVGTSIEINAGQKHFKRKRRIGGLSKTMQ